MAQVYQKEMLESYVSMLSHTLEVIKACIQEIDDSFEGRKESLESSFYTCEILRAAGNIVDMAEGLKRITVHQNHTKQYWASEEEDE